MALRQLPSRITAVLTLLLLCATPVRAQDGGPWRGLDDVVRQWNALEQQRSAVDTRWRERKPLLELQLELLGRERQSLTEFIDTRRQASGEVDQRRLELAARQETLEQNQAMLEVALGDAELTVQSLMPRLPPPLQDAWEEQLAVLTANPDVTVSERLQTLVSMLTAAEEFDRRLTVHRTTMTDTDGNTLEVRQLYLGLSQGWYTSADGSSTGVGHAGRDGWAWIKADDLDSVSLIAAFEMIENPALAAPVTLPVQLKEAQP
ncbi:MAG: DUF3450 family protein [Pseudomonadota bacterium]